MSEVYLILGSPGSGRRTVLFDLIDGGFDSPDRIAIALSDAEVSDGFDSKLNDKANVTILRYAALQSIEIMEADTIFIIAEGRTDPADIIEAFQQWLKRTDHELARIIFFCDCALAESQSRLAPYFDCCVHFADVVLLNNRESVNQKWLREFQKRYADLHYPCLFENVKKGKVKNPGLVLDPVARRASLIFDDIDAIDQLEIDEDNLPDEPIDLVAPAAVSYNHLTLPTQRDVCIPLVTARSQHLLVRNPLLATIFIL